MTAARITTTVYAGDIELTENRAGVAGRQVRMGHEMYLYLTKEQAAQWLPVITEIAEETKA